MSSITFFYKNFRPQWGVEGNQVWPEDKLDFLPEHERDRTAFNNRADELMKPIMEKRYAAYTAKAK